MSDKLIGIYKITSPSGKVYIGQSVNIEERFTEYKGYHKTVKAQIRLWNSLKKYGFDLHKFEIKELCDFDDLNCRERYWQDHYDVIGKMGLNCKLQQTHDKSGKLSEETKQKISKSNSGKTQSPEARKKISLAHKGRKLSDTQREILKLACHRMNAKLTDDMVKDICIMYTNNYTSEEIIKKYPLATTSILADIRLKKTYKSITEKYDILTPSRRGQLGSRSKKVKCIEDNLTFDNTCKAAEYYNTTRSTVFNSAKGKSIKNKIKKTFIYLY